MATLIPPVVGFLVRRFLWRSLLDREAGRALRSSILGMSLGLVPMITVLVVSDGMIEGIVGRFKETVTYHIQVQPLGLFDPGELPALAERIRGLEGVEGAWIETQGFALAYSGARRTGVTVRGLESEFLASAGWSRYVRYIEGTPAFSDQPEAQLGEEAARRLGVRVGDEIKLLTARRVEGRRLLPRITPLRVSAIVTSGYQEVDRLWLLMPVERTHLALPLEDYPPFLGIKVRPGHSEERIAQDIAALLPFGWRVRPWFEINRNQYQNYQSTRAILLVIMSMILIVSSFNIASSLLMTYLERRKEVAILKSIGLSPSAVELYFGLLGLVSSAIGTFLGIALGVLTAINVNHLIHSVEGAVQLLERTFLGAESGFKVLDPAFYLQTIPIRLSWETLFLIALLSVSLGLAAAWFPARKAARLKPLTIIRKI